MVCMQLFMAGISWTFDLILFGNECVGVDAHDKFTLIFFFFKCAKTKCFLFILHWKIVA